MGQLVGVIKENAVPRVSLLKDLRAACLKVFVALYDAIGSLCRAKLVASPECKGDWKVKVLQHLVLSEEMVAQEAYV